MLMEFSRPLFRIFSATFVICSVNFRVFDFQDSSASRRVRWQRAPHAFGQRTVEAVQERIDSYRRGWGGRGQGVGGRYFCTAFSLFLFLNRTAACSLAYSLVNTVILSGWPRDLFPFFLRSCDSQNDPLSNESATTAITATAAPVSGRHVVVLSAFDPHRQALTFHTPCTSPTDPVRIELLFFSCIWKIEKVKILLATRDDESASSIERRQWEWEEKRRKAFSPPSSPLVSFCCALLKHHSFSKLGESTRRGRHLSCCKKYEVL